jgi:hypothetical protein
LSDGDEWDATTEEDLEFQPFESKKKSKGPWHRQYLVVSSS